MRIDSLSISRFKCLLELSLPCLSRITLLGGPNCMGKTSVLEAVFLFFDRYNPGLLLRQFGWRGYPSVALVPTELFGPFFFDFDLEREIVICLQSGKRREKVTITFVPQFRNGMIPAPAVEQRGQTPFVTTDARPVGEFALEFKYQENRKDVEVSQLTVAQGVLAMQSSKVRSESRRANIIFTGHAGTSPSDAERFGNLDKDGRALEAVSFMKGFFPQLRGLSLIPGPDQKLLLYADVGLARKVPVGWAGEGLSRLLSIYLAINDARDGVVLIDEIGGGIHYSALPKVWRAVSEAAEKCGCQVIATTHSYECIRAARDGLQGLLKPDFTYVLLEKTDKGLVPKCYPYDVLDEALEAGLELRG